MSDDKQASGTPRTDAECGRGEHILVERLQVPTEFARTLEQQLLAAQAELTALRSDIARHVEIATAAQSEVEAMREKLQRTEHALDAYAKRVLADPVAWLLQHDETGRDCFCANNGIGSLEQFQRDNPRYHLVCELRK